MQLKSMRVFLEDKEPQESGPPVHCSEPGCNKATRHSKPHCCDHIKQMTYVKNVEGELQRREKEKRQLTKERRLGKKSHLVGEALAVLWEHQKVTAPGLTRHIDLSHQQSTVLLRSLAKHGYVTLRRNKRGVLTATACFGEQLPNRDLP